MGKGPARGPSKGPGRGGYATTEVSDDFLEHFCLGRRSLTSRGPYRLLAHSSGEERSGEYLFDIDTGKLQTTESLESIGQFSTEALVLESPIPIDRPANQLLPCIQVLSSEVMREIQKPENAAAFVVLPSQFNGVEFPSHCSIVESVEDYKYDHTGGPCGQLATHPGLAQFLLDNACTHRRPNGIDATRQLLRKVNGALEEKGIFSKKLQFSVLNGYLKMPVPDSEEVAATILAALNGSLHELRLLLMRDARVTCGLAPSKTEFTNATHPVNLVYASAVPVNAYVNGIGAVAKGFGDDQMQAFQRTVAELFLIAQYLGALQVASNTAKVLKVRSKVLLMPLGGGAFKNSWESIVKSIAMAVELCQSDLDLLDIHVLVLDGGKAGKSDDTPAEQRVKELLQKHQKLRGT